MTESAQHGHYVTFLVHQHGAAVYVSLMRAITEARPGAGGSVTDLVASQARLLGSHLPDSAVAGLVRERIDLAGRGSRTWAYEASTVVSVFHRAASVPHEAVLIAQLRRFLRLYEMATAGLDSEMAADNVDAPPEAQSGIESKGYRWRLRAEGRNRTMVRRAKELQGYRCQVCRRDHAADYGDTGKRAVEAHHLVPFAELDSRPGALDPRIDFSIVCPTCHRMLHSETPPLLPERLAERLGCAQIERG